MSFKRLTHRCISHRSVSIKYVGEYFTRNHLRTQSAILQTSTSYPYIHRAQPQYLLPCYHPSPHRPTFLFYPSQFAVFPYFLALGSNRCFSPGAPFLVVSTFRLFFQANTRFCTSPTSCLALRR